MNDKIKDFLSVTIHAALEGSNLLSDLKDIYRNIDACPQPSLGQYAFKTFSTAKLNSLTPPEFSEKLAELLKNKNLIKGLNKSGPYINFTVCSNKIASCLVDGIDENYNVRNMECELPHRYMIEHSQPNTHKELHIGHTRNSVLGDTLCRLLRFSGHVVFAENYHGDEGAHVAKCIWYIQKYNLSPSSEEDPGSWLGKMYVQSTAVLESSSEAEALEFKAEISSTLKQIEDKHGSAYELWKETRSWSLNLFYQVYKWLDINFDGHRCESDVSEESFKVVNDYLNKGIFIRSEGTVGADLSESKLGFCMLLKSDGRGLYATKDLALALKRFEEHSPDTCVYVVDNRQSHHFKQVFATLKLMGFREAERCFHLAYEMVETKNGAMSSRSGNIVPILELVDQLEQHASSILLARYSTDWDTKTISDMAGKIALSAIRYGMIKVDPDSKIIFDMDGWLTLEGNTGPYLQYVYARMNSLKRKNGDQDILILSNINWELLTNSSETQLLAHLANFNECVSISCQKLKPNIFANYTYELAKKFNSFYAESPIHSEENDEIRKARMALVNISQSYLRKALELLAIPPVDKM